eukprot:3885200-Prorocentrum_lima.AAC.1
MPGTATSRASDLFPARELSIVPELHVESILVVSALIARVARARTDGAPQGAPSLPSLGEARALVTI